MIINYLIYFIINFSYIINKNIKPYDITDRKSFENVDHWINQTSKHLPKTWFIVLWATKSDLEEKREVRFEEGMNKATEYEIMFIETSAKSGVNINEMLEVMAQEVLSRNANNDLDYSKKTNSVRLTYGNAQEEKKKGWW